MSSYQSKRNNARAALDPLVTESSSSTGAGMSRMDFVSKAIMAPFNHKKNDSTKILADRKSLSAFAMFHPNMFSRTCHHDPTHGKRDSECLFQTSCGCKLKHIPFTYGFCHPRASPHASYNRFKAYHIWR